MTHECKCTWSSPSGKPSDGWCTVESSYYRALLLLLKWLTPSFFFHPPPPPFKSLCFHTGLLNLAARLFLLSHTRSEEPEKGSVFSQACFCTRFQSLDFHGKTKEHLISTRPHRESPRRRDPKMWQTSILSFYKLDVQITTAHMLDTWMFICVFPIF